MTVFKLTVNGCFKKREGVGRESTTRRKEPLSCLLPDRKSQLNQIADQASMVTRARNCFARIAVKESLNVPGFLLV